jgi:hypothetical protein
LDSKGKAGKFLKTFCREFGVSLRFYGSKESPAEGVVRELRKKWYRIMFRKKVPKMFWDYVAMGMGNNVPDPPEAIGSTAGYHYKKSRVRQLASLFKFGFRTSQRLYGVCRMS